ncbi:MAG: UDP-N-acetylmuramate dehydrogenase [Clostridia bacterium]|nr:UDP-N-acetylmuramate dehydrogenase [Clostridia bacterium]
MCDYAYIHDCIIIDNMRSPSSYGGKGIIKQVIYPTRISGAAELSKYIRQGYKVIGACTNTLVSDGKVTTPVICTKKLKGILHCSNGLYALAGENLPSLCTVAAEYGLSGMEELSGIPGSVGGGAVMNCGCFGKEISQIIEYVDIAVNGKIQRLAAKDIPWGYRSSSLEGEGIIVGVKFNLTSSDVSLVRKRMREIGEMRLTQPKQPSLGSTFKRHDGVSAGYYIDKAGLKGAKVGGAMISDIHAGFIVNTGGGSADDYIKLMGVARDKVQDVFGITLQPEIVLL